MVHPQAGVCIACLPYCGGFDQRSSGSAALQQWIAVSILSSAGALWHIRVAQWSSACYTILVLDVRRAVWHRTVLPQSTYGRALQYSMDYVVPRRSRIIVAHQLHRLLRADDAHRHEPAQVSSPVSASAPHRVGS